MSFTGAEPTPCRSRTGDGGALLTESYEFVWCPAIARVAELPFPRDRQLRRGVRQTLLNVKAAAEEAQSAR